MTKVTPILLCHQSEIQCINYVKISAAFRLISNRILNLSLQCPLSLKRHEFQNISVTAVRVFMTGQSYFTANKILQMLHVISPAHRLYTCSFQSTVCVHLRLTLYCAKHSEPLCQIWHSCNE